MSNTTDGVSHGKGPAGGSGEGPRRDSGGNPPGGGGGQTQRGGAGGRKPPPRPAAALDRDSVLRATAAVLDDRGFEKTTIRTISTHLGCAVGSIYRHFTDKNQLLDEVVQGHFKQIAAAAEAGHRPAATTRAFLAAAANRPEQYRLMFWLSELGRGKGEPSAVPSVIRRLVAAWAQPEQLGAVSAARSHWGRLHGELMLGAHDGTGADLEAAMAALEGDPAAAPPARPRRDAKVPVAE